MSNFTSDTPSKFNGATKDLSLNPKNVYQQAKGSAESLSHSIGERAGTAVAKFQDSASEYYNTSRGYVIENPVKGVAIAAATGLVCGTLLTLAMRSRR